MADGAVACAMQGLPISTVFVELQGRSRSRVALADLNFPMQANGAEMMRLACAWQSKAVSKFALRCTTLFSICAPLDQIDARVEQMKFIMEEASRIVLDGFTVKLTVPSSTKTASC